jgi:hypothetical protein
MFLVRNVVKQGDAPSPLLFNFALEYTIQVNHDGLKLNGTHELLVYAADIKISGGSVRTIKKNRSLVVSSKETELIKLSTWSYL